MTKEPVNYLLKETSARVEPGFVMLGAGLSRDLPESMAMPMDRALILFKGPTFAAALHEAELASIDNPHAWKCRACICGEWTVGYEVRT